MLDSFLKVAYAEKQKTAMRDRVVELMSRLPVEELLKIRETGEVKLAWGDLVPGGDNEATWLDHFKDTPLYSQAIALEEECLKLQAANQQRSSVENQERDQMYQEQDALRLQKKLLELELAKSRLAAESAAQPPPMPSPGMGAPPGMTAQGAGALGDVASEGAQDGAIGKMAEAMRASLAKHAGVGEFLAKAAPAAMNFAKAHPGAVIGGGLGALHGLMRQDGGVGSAVLEGAGGAALGHGAQHIAQQHDLPGKLKGMLHQEVPPAPTATVAKEAASKPLPFVSEKVAFMGALLGSLGGAAAKAGMGAAAKGALGAGMQTAAKGGLGGIASAAGNWMKQNPMKAVGAGLNAASNFAQAKQQGQGHLGAAISGLAGGASAL